MDLKTPLKKVKKNSQLCGVCAGLAKHLDIDVSWIRVLFVIFGIFTGFTIIFYIILACVLEEEDLSNDINEKQDDINIPKEDKK